MDENFFSPFSWLRTAGVGVAVAHHSKLQPAATSIFLQPSTLIVNRFTYLSCSSSLRHVWMSLRQKADTRNQAEGFSQRMYDLETAIMATAWHDILGRLNRMNE